MRGGGEEDLGDDSEVPVLEEPAGGVDPQKRAWIRETRFSKVLMVGEIPAILQDLLQYC